MFKLTLNDQTKSVVRHVLTAVGTIVLLFGLNHWLPLVDYLKESIDPVWDAVKILAGFVVTVAGWKFQREVKDSAESK